MSDFKRERRYFVLKTKHLNEDQYQQLTDIVDSINHPPLECVVVESDWPNYEDTWKAVEQVANGGYQSPYDLIEQQQAWIAELEAKTSCCMGVGNGNGRLFVYGDHESIKTAQRYVLERDDLAATVERLRGALKHLHHNTKASGAEMGLALGVASDALEATPRQNLNAVKREVTRDAYLQGLWDANGRYMDGYSRADMCEEYLNKLYPSDKDGE